VQAANACGDGRKDSQTAENLHAGLVLSPLFPPLPIALSRGE
jgi:hypothetical protein